MTRNVLVTFVYKIGLASCQISDFTSARRWFSATGTSIDIFFQSSRWIPFRLQGTLASSEPQVTPIDHDAPQLESMNLEKKKRLNDSDDHSAPGSVYLAAEQLVRDDVSDLSGSYVGGLNNSRSSVPRTVYQEASATGPWRQAYVASRLPPPRANAFIVPPLMTHRRSGSLARSNSDGSVEVISSHSKGVPIEILELQNQSHSCIPVTVLLIDGSKRTYELLQIWIDRSADSVRSVVQAIQRGIPEKKWMTAYDGIFQVRGNRFTQLIHILQLAKYDIRPNEILIAKPCSMSSKVATALSNSAIRHLTNIHVITTFEEGGYRPKPSDSAPLLLSSAAQKRIYCPDGIVSHRHATQFLTFSPPFDVKFQTLDTSMDDVHSTQGSNVSSIGLSSVQGQMVDDLLASLRRSREQSTMRNQEPRDSLVPPLEESESSTVSRPQQPQSLETVEASPARRNFARVIAQLNCFKTKQRVAALACCPHSENDDQRNTSTHRKNRLTSVAEEPSTKLEFRAADDESPSLTGTEVEASMFYARCGDGRHIRLMEI